MQSRLSPLQGRILELLAGMSPSWTLVGGGALAGFVIGHRGTRDLDLFWRDRQALDGVDREVEARLSASGLQVEPLQTSPAFKRLIVRSDDEDVIVDLVADPIAPAEEPEERAPGLLVDTPHEILVQKLCALLSRSEVRDLEDVRVLLEHGGDLRRAIADAARRDGGFSPPTLAWLLQTFPLEQAGRLGFDEAGLRVFRDELIDGLLS